MSDRKKILMKSIVATIFTIGMFVVALSFLSGTGEGHYEVAAFAAFALAVVFSNSPAFATTLVVAVFAAFGAAAAVVGAGVAAAAAVVGAGVVAVVAFALAVILAFANDIDKHNRTFVIICYIAEFISIAGIISAIVFL